MSEPVEGPSPAEIGLVTAALISAVGTVGLKPPEYAERARQVLVALACIREPAKLTVTGWVALDDAEMLDSGQGYHVAFDPMPQTKLKLPVVRAELRLFEVVEGVEPRAPSASTVFVQRLRQQAAAIAHVWTAQQGTAEPDVRCRRPTAPRGAAPAHRGGAMSERGADRYVSCGNCGANVAVEGCGPTDGAAEGGLRAMLTPEAAERFSRAIHDARMPGGCHSPHSEFLARLFRYGTGLRASVTPPTGDDDTRVGP